MRVWAIAGGIAAGKSTVARTLARRGARRIDADRIGHAVLRAPAVRRRLLDAFGPDIVAADGGIDRRRLGKAVFGKSARLRRLNAIVHPEIARRIRRRLEILEAAGCRVALVDAALFFEFDLGRAVDGVIAVTAPREVRIARLRQARGWSRREAESRIASQPRVAVWTRRADLVIDTDCSRAELRRRIDAVWDELRRPRRRSG